MSGNATRTRRSSSLLLTLPVEMSSRRCGRPVISRDWTKYRVLGDDDAPLPIGDVYERLIGSAIAIGQVDGVSGVVAGLFQPTAETLGQLRVMP